VSEITLGEAVASYIETVKGSARRAALAELDRLSRWYGSDKPLGAMRGHDVATYAEAMGPSSPETSRRAAQVRGFFVYLKKQGVLEQNLGPHLRLKKATKAKRGIAAGAAATSEIELTREGVDALKAELESLMEQRISVRDDIRRAMLDKDFRENAPLDAARDEQAHLESRIRDTEDRLRHAVIIDTAAKGGLANVGSVVRLLNLASDSEQTFTLVSPNEVDPSNGRISIQSPVGVAVSNRGVGDEVEVIAPAGAMRFRVLEVIG
jgi:transcription elongation factor GreA